MKRALNRNLGKSLVFCFHDENQNVESYDKCSGKSIKERITQDYKDVGLTYQFSEPDYVIDLAASRIYPYSKRSSNKPNLYNGLKKLAH